MAEYDDAEQTFYPSARSLFEEAADGLRNFHGADRPRLADNMLHMALAPDTQELGLIQSAFVRSDAFPQIETVIYGEGMYGAAGNIRTITKPGTYGSDLYFEEFSISGAEPPVQADLSAIEEMCAKFPLRRWTAPMCFAATGDKEIDDHIAMLVEYLFKLDDKFTENLPIGSHSSPGASLPPNCLVYFVPEEARQIIKGSFLRVRTHWPRLRSTLNQETRRKTHGGAECKFRAEYPAVKEWLADKGVTISAKDTFVPFAPFHMYNLDGFLVADKDGRIKASVGIIDSLARRRIKLELATEFFVRSFGLPGINRRSNQDVTSNRRDNSLYARYTGPEKTRWRPTGIDPSVYSGVGFISDLEIDTLRYMYRAELSPGMTREEIVQALRSVFENKRRIYQRFYP